MKRAYNSLIKPIPRRTMATIGNLQRMNAQTLSEKILAAKEGEDPTLAVVDVRDDGNSQVQSSALTFTSLDC